MGFARGVQLMKQVPLEHPTTPDEPACPIEFRTLFETEFRFVVRTLSYLGIRSNDVRDVAHDVFLHVFRHLADYDPARPIRPWLFGFAYRIARDFRQLARHRHESRFGVAESIDPTPMADDVLIHSQSVDLALSALDQLDEDERSIFVAHYLDELPIPEVATILGVPLNTAYTRLRRARMSFEASARRLAKKENP
jgi:RNA polymerase sigma-70 factor, ECF subfamily